MTKARRTRRDETFPTHQPVPRRSDPHSKHPSIHEVRSLWPADPGRQASWPVQIFQRAGNETSYAPFIPSALDLVLDQDQDHPLTSSHFSLSHPSDPRLRLRSRVQCPALSFDPSKRVRRSSAEVFRDTSRQSRTAFTRGPSRPRICHSATGVVRRLFVQVSGIRCRPAAEGKFLLSTCSNTRANGDVQGRSSSFGKAIDRHATRRTTPCPTSRCG